MTKKNNEDVKIYVLSLPCDNERRSAIKEQFKEYSIFFNFFPAIDLRKKNNINQTPNIPKKRAPKMTDAEIGCSISHITIMKDFLNTEKKYCLILEDDILGNDCDMEKAIKFTSILPKDGIALLGGLQGLKNNNYIYGKEIDKIPNNTAYKIHRICKSFLARTCCYMVTREAAIKIVNKQVAKLERADQWDVLLKNFREIYYLDIFSHPTDLAHSHIEKDRKKAQKSFFHKLYSDGILRALKRTFIKFYVKKIIKNIGFQKVPSKRPHLTHAKSALL